MVLISATSLRWRREFSVSAQMSEPSSKTVTFQMAAAKTAKSGVVRHA